MPSGDVALMQLLACPSCRAALSEEAEGVLRCSAEGTRYVRESGIWRLLDAPAGSDAEEFLAHYRAVRRDEGWGAAGDEYYRALPFEDTTGRHADIWSIRARTHRLFIAEVMGPLEAGRQRQRILDLGAGNCWLSHRLARRGHEVAAVDLNDDPMDGLGAHTRYDPETRFEVVEASFDRLPWANDTIDMGVYNGSLHYSSDYAATLREALRVLVPTGRVVILDSPFYQREESGAAMVREREVAFRADYGCHEWRMANEGFLTPARLHELGDDLGVEWRVLHTDQGIRRVLRPLKNRIVGRREQARFPVVVGVPRHRGETTAASRRRSFLPTK